VNREIAMRKLIVGVSACLILCGQLAAPVYAADKHTKTVGKSVKSTPPQPGAAAATSKTVVSDSNLDGYRLERESCCGPQ